MNEVIVRTHSADETYALGAALAAVALPGDTWLLLGGFGVGKTTLVQGIARGLGIAEPVTSPSFVIANEYEGHLPLYHLDLYRIEVMDAATLETLAEYFGGTGLCVVEWPANVPHDLIADAARLRLAVTGETSRAISLESGPERLRAALVAWNQDTVPAG